MFLERSIANRHQLMTKVEQETARANERQMEIQHRLHRPDQNEERYDGNNPSLELLFLCYSLLLFI